MYAPTESENDMDTRVEELLRMLTYKRKAGSAGEEAFVDRFIRPLMRHENATYAFEDTYGNIFIEVAGGSKQMFTSHCDTVHQAPKPGESYFQEVMYDKNMMLAYKKDGYPLGADDAAGCWMLIEILRAKIPCWLAFFREEECGGNGSRFAAKQHKDFLKQFDSAVAFDRRSDTDIITYQSCGRCASDAWAKALAEQLNAQFEHFEYAPCDGGVFTDTANLTDLIPECSNLSVGYRDEHHPEETLDVEHLLNLREAVLAIDWLDLPIERDPSVADYGDWGWPKGYGSYAKWGGYRGSLVDPIPFDRGKKKALPAPDEEPLYDDEGFEIGPIDYTPMYTEDDLYDMTYADMQEACRECPEEFAYVVWKMLWGRDA